MAGTEKSVENEAMLAFVRATITKLDAGRMGANSALSSLAIVIGTWAKDDPELFHLICGDPVKRQ